VANKLHIPPALTPSKKPGCPYNRRLEAALETRKISCPCSDLNPISSSQFPGRSTNHALPTASLLSKLLAGWPRNWGLTVDRTRNCHFWEAIWAALGLSQLSIWWVPGLFFLTVTRLVREADYSRPSGNEIKKAWSYINNAPPPPKFSFITWYVMKHRMTVKCDLYCNNECQKLQLCYFA